MGNWATYPERAVAGWPCWCGIGDGKERACHSVWVKMQTKEKSLSGQ